MNEEVMTIREQIFSPKYTKAEANKFNLSTEEMIKHLRAGYEDIAYLSEGGMGVINLASDKTCLRKVVIKTLQKNTWMTKRPY